MSTDVLGKPQDRLDGRLKVTGRLRYSGDRPIENVAYGYLVTSTIARGEIRAMDVSEAEKSTGVVAVFTPFHSLKLYDGLTQVEGANSGEIDPPLQDNKIRYYGQIIALVVADTFEQARDAAARVKVDYNEEQPVASWEAGLTCAFPPAAETDRNPRWQFLPTGYRQSTRLFKELKLSLTRLIQSQSITTIRWSRMRPLRYGMAID